MVACRSPKPKMGVRLTPCLFGNVRESMWRQHSWLIHRKPRSNKIVETTRPRVLYYGFAMPPKLSERFADEILDSIMF